MNNFKTIAFFTLLLLLSGCNPSSVYLAIQPSATSRSLISETSNVYSTQESTITLPPPTIVLPTNTRIPAHILDDIFFNPTGIILKTEGDNYKQLGSYVEITPDCAHTGNYGLKLHKERGDSSPDWRIVNNGESPYSFDVTNYQALELWVRGTTSGEGFVGVDIASPHGGNTQIYFSKYVEITSSEWRLVHIPFSDFKKANPIEWMTFIYDLGFDIFSDTGTLCIDDIQFTP